MEDKDGIVEITTHGAYDIYRKYFMFSLFRGKFYKQGPTIFFIIIMVGIIVVIYSGFSLGFEVGDVIFLSILILLIIFMAFLMIGLPRLYYKSARKLIEVTTKYTFTEDYMLTQSYSELANGSSKIEYSALHKVYEIDEMILIFISNSQAFIIPKKDSIPKDILHLNKILKSKVKKYYDYCKKK